MSECAWKWGPGESFEDEETERTVQGTIFMVSSLAIMAGVGIRQMVAYFHA